MAETSVEGLVLRDPAGAGVPIEGLLAGDPRPRWLVVQALRYFG